jgi:serine/threonine protein kinase
VTSQIGQYKILSELGAGGMGVVYRAMDVLLEREVALKLLRNEFAANPVVLERFRTEARMQARLSHPNIAQLYALVEEGGALCIVMEYVDGTALSRYMPLAWRKAVPVILQTLEGLDCAHRRGVLHRDIKPDNIVIDREGTVKVMDFGIAHALGSARLTREKSIIGTLEYMSPERIQGAKADQRSDIYSVGVLLFEMIAGRLPFMAETEYELLRQHVNVQPPRASQFAADVPPLLDDAIGKAMCKDLGGRFASCSEMAEALRTGCRAAGVDIHSVAEALNFRQTDPAAQPADEVARWCQRIEAMVAKGDFESAARLADTALNDHPGSIEIARWRDQLRKKVSQPPARPATAQTTEPELSETDKALRQVLLQILGAEATGEFAEAHSIAAAAMEARSENTLFQIAQAYLATRHGPSERA